MTFLSQNDDKSLLADAIAEKVSELGARKALDLLNVKGRVISANDDELRDAIANKVNVLGARKALTLLNTEG